MERIEQARLGELSQLVCAKTHWEGFQCHICERAVMARELLALRQREERLRQALENSVLMLEAMGVGKDNCTLIEARAALEAKGEKD